MTRGPLPARVYWFRRLLELGTAVLLVVAIARLLGDGSDASSDDGPEAELAAGAPTSSSTGSAPSTAVQPRHTAVTSPTTSPTPTLAVPVGTCSGSDIAVTPTVTDAVAGRDVSIVLELRTISSEACTWQVAPDALTVKLSSGKDAIWSSRDCPRAIPRRDVVVRKAVTTKLGIVWTQAKRSGDECLKGTGWALPGWYHVTAAALGGEPADAQFELTTPTATTVTKTATPQQSPSGTPKQSPSGTPKQSPTGKPKHSPSGAVEPD
jgi:hypothetical protein